MSTHHRENTRRIFIKDSTLLFSTSLVFAPSVLIASCSKQSVGRIGKSARKPSLIDKEIVFIDQTSNFREVPEHENFRSFPVLPSLPDDIEVPFPWKTERLLSQTFGNRTDSAFMDEEEGYILHMMVSTPGTPDTGTGSPQYKVWSRISLDMGKTFTRPTLVTVDGHTYDKPIEGVVYGRNGFNVNTTTPIIKSSSGDIIVPINLHPWDGKLNKIYNPADAFIFQDAGALVGKWNAVEGAFKWKFGGWLRLDHNMSTRGLSEPSIFELKDGRFAMISRGSNYRRPELPGYHWLSISTDGCYSWSDPVPFTYSDGSNFFVPASHPTVFRSRANGKLYWLGNLVDNNPDGSYPRFPIKIGVIDEEKMGLVRESVLELDSRNPDMEGEKMQLSNFDVMEHQENSEILVHLVRRDRHEKAPGKSWYRIKL